MLELSVVIVSYNTRALLDACLRAVFATVRRHSLEVIVVDNASVDGTPGMLRERWPEVRLIESATNVGFARGVNLGLRAASGASILLLNSDTDVLPGALDHLVQYMAIHPTAGIVAPHLLNTDLTDQGTARAFPTPWAVVFGRKALLTRLWPANPWSRRYLVGREHRGIAPFMVDWVSGACLMLRRSVVEQVGGLDESFFMYWEDADLCRRVGAAGFTVWCVPTARVIHHEGKSSRGRPARLVWAFHASAYRYYVKHHALARSTPVRQVVGAALYSRAALLIAGNTLAGLLQATAIARSLVSTVHPSQSR